MNNEPPVPYFAPPVRVPAPPPQQEWPPPAYPPPAGPPSAYPPPAGPPVAAAAPPTYMPNYAATASPVQVSYLTQAAPPQRYSPSYGRPAQSFRLRDLLPGRDWWESSAWRQGSLGLFVACALTPFILLQATENDGDVRHAAWGFTIYYAIIWLFALKALIKPERVSNWRLLQVIATTGVLGVSVAITVERHLAANASTLMHSIFTVGFPEEIAKALPLLIVLFTAGTDLRPRTYMYLGAVSGLAFGAVESVSYTALYGSAIKHTGDTRLVTGIIWRLLTDSLFHAALAGIVGVFIGFAAWAPKGKLALIGGGLAVAAVLHGTYDRTAGHWSGTFVAAVVILIFAGYIHRSDEMLIGATWSRGG